MDENCSVINIKNKKAIYVYDPEHCYELMEKGRRTSTFSVKRKSQPDFISTKSLQESTTRTMTLKSPTRGRPEILNLLLLYTSTRPVTEEKHKNIAR
uniref:Uncharacterized protein n=1 Tax=Glossina morsitans morsitans TaxID=37546 RepID=A0A1B0G954_GLOMM